MGTVLIAPATATECGECARLLVDQLREHGIDSSPDTLAEVLEVAITDARGGFLMLARDDGRSVGVAYVATIMSAEHCGPAAWLEELYVTRDARGRGIGTALLTAVFEQARKTGIVAIDLEIDASHARAISLYQRHGFRRLKRSRWVREFK